MNKKDTTYRMPEGFNPYSAVDAARGLADAVHWMHFDGPASEETMATADKLGLDALVTLLKDRIHELHDYIHEIGNSTALHLPMSEAELEALRWRGANSVRQDPPVYGTPRSVRLVR